jgi:hypothetical protein
MNITELSNRWLELKVQEDYVISERRYIEDQISSLMKIQETLEGVETKKSGNFVIKVTGRIDRKVNSEMLQEIAAENGLSEHLSALFRWTPAINMTAWKRCSPEITNVLLGAVTSKTGRPSYKITIEE